MSLPKSPIIMAEYLDQSFSHDGINYAFELDAVGKIL